MRQTTINLAATLIVCDLLLAPAIEAKTLYRQTILNTFADSLSIQYPYTNVGNAINDSDIIAGTVTFQTPSGNQSGAFVSNPDGSLTYLGASIIDGATDSYAMGINAGGQVAGYSPVLVQGFFYAHAFISDGNGVNTDLGSLGGLQSQAFAVNDNGLVTGTSYIANDKSDQHAFLATAGGPMVDLGVLAGDTSIGYAINNTGQVTGYSTTSQKPSRAFITGPNGQNMRELQTPGNNSSGKAINASGQVAGYLVSSTDSVMHAFVTGVDGADPRQLLVPNESVSSATGINDAGIVIGTYIHKSLGERSFVTDIDGNAKDLNNLVIMEDPNACTPLLAKDINNNGKITGSCGNVGAGSKAAIILTPEEVESVPADKENSLKLSESLQDLLDCDQQHNCNLTTAAKGSYSLTLKLSAATLSSHGVDLGQLQTGTRIAFRAGKYVFSGTLSDADQAFITKLPATWTAKHSECKKYAANNSCLQSKTVVDGSVKIATDKKHNLTITIKGNTSTVNASAFGQQLFAGLCPTASAGNSQLTDSAMFTVGPKALPMTVKIDCTVKQRSKTVAGTPYVLNNVTGKAVLTAEP